MSAAYYLLKMVLCSGILFGYYHLALRNRLFHQWNRFYLLSAVGISVVLPLLRFEVWQTAHDQSEQPVLYSLHQTDVYFFGSSAAALSVEEWIWIGYCIITLILLGSIVFSVLRIRRLLKTHTIQRLDGIRFVNTEEPGTPFSFFRFIFWNKSISLTSDAGQKILRHEMVHVTELHTLDKLCIRTIACLFWANPFFWFIGKELRSIHEFIADKKSAGGADITAFAQLLLQIAYPHHHQSLINPFFQTSIKRRIAMLTKIQHPRRNYFGRILALPLLVLTVVLFSFRSQSAANGQNDVYSGLSYISETSDTIPKPKKAIRSVDVKTKKEITITYEDGSSETLSENEANKRGLIHNGGYGNQSTKAAPPANVLRIADTGKKPPLIILNGEEISQDEMNKINPNNIESIDVLKGESATSTYGKKAEGGVIKIKLKSAGSVSAVVAEDSSLKVVEVHGYGKPAINSRKEVVVMGKPMPGRAGKEGVVAGRPTTPQPTKEVTVIGYPNKEKSNPDANLVFTQAEEPASIDKKDWRLFLEKNVLPVAEEAAQKKMGNGKHTFNMRFIVEKDGSLSEISVLEKDNQAVNQKLVEIMKQSPRWKPATQNGKAVRSYHTQPVTLMIEEQHTPVEKNTKQ